MLDFVPNAVHSGIYAAQAEGFYEDAGVDLKMQPPGESTDAPKLLGAGKVEFAILDIHDLGIARERGIDLVGVMPIVQRPLAAVIARGDGPVRRPRELEGHTRRRHRPALRRSRGRLRGRSRRRRPGQGRRGDDRLQRRRLARRRQGRRRDRLLERRGRGAAAPGRAGPDLQGRPTSAPRPTPSWSSPPRGRRSKTTPSWSTRSSPRPAAATPSPSSTRRGARRPARRQPGARTRRTAGAAEGPAARPPPAALRPGGPATNGPPGTSSTACSNSR